MRISRYMLFFPIILRYYENNIIIEPEKAEFQETSRKSGPKSLNIFV